jgi:hypothetical protein
MVFEDRVGDPIRGRFAEVEVEFHYCGWKLSAVSETRMEKHKLLKRRNMVNLHNPPDYSVPTYP